jgi:hypothetical protein
MSNGAQWGYENASLYRNRNRVCGDVGYRAREKRPDVIGQYIRTTPYRTWPLRKGRPIMNRNDNLWTWGIGLFIGLIALVCVLCPTKHKELSDYQKFEIIDRAKHSKLDAWLEGR